MLEPVVRNATMTGAPDAMRSAVLCRHTVQLDVNVLGAAGHTAEAQEAAVATHSEPAAAASPMSVTIEPCIACDAGWRL